MAEEINAHGYSKAGYQNIVTSDGLVHGQVKQSGRFSFSRVYYSGHEVPFYQPLAALEMFERAINGKDIATGKKHADYHYQTKGDKKSTFREGNSTIQFDVVPTNATYNTSTGAPNPAMRARSAMSSAKSELLKREIAGLNRGRKFKP